MSEKLLNITINIADRTYPLKIKPEEEQSVRAAAKDINQKLKELEQNYDAKDKQDYLAMCALTLAVDNLRKKEQVEDPTLANKLKELDNILSDFLEQ